MELTFCRGYNHFNRLTSELNTERTNSSQGGGMLNQLLEWFWSDPLRGIAAAVSLFAMAATPVALLILGRQEYIFTRRGRTYRKPEWWSIVTGAALVMGVPGLVLVLLVKSQYFDSDRYEFDPNRTNTVLDQGRQYRTAQEAFDAIEAELARVRSARDQLLTSVEQVQAATGGLRELADGSAELDAQLSPIIKQLETLRDAVDLDAFDPSAVLSGFSAIKEQLEAVSMSESLRLADDLLRNQMLGLAEERKELVEAVKAVDSDLLDLRAVAPNSPELKKSLDPILESLVAVRRAIGLDAPQQLEDAESPPADVVELMAALNEAGLGSRIAVPIASTTIPGGADLGTPGLSPAQAQGPGLSPTEREAELTNVPEPQQTLAGFLPLTNLPGGWEIGKSGDRYLESFNAGNLFEKIDGRAESFVLYDVVGMAYTYYHPKGDPSNEVQLYIFELSNALNALGKYGTEKPDELEPLELGAEGYASGASVFFHAKSYYVQIVPTTDSAEFSEFALQIAQRISNEMIPGSAPEPSAKADESMPLATNDPSISEAAEETETAEVEEVDPTIFFSLLPQGEEKTRQEYVAEAVFGYEFLTDVFTASYVKDNLNWQAFIRTYATPDKAKEIAGAYRDEIELFGGTITEIETEFAESCFLAESFGWVEVVFQKGNALGGISGDMPAENARELALEYAGTLPAESPFLSFDDE